ncbi:hypothetical protein VTK73DRAFT_110 [Phialemonium thermophilum]|uniref:Rab-GAP TBC domain-containing protein n=1 Tax=Phialemonium thermophilum TaxID=223376 RepID=A0ABR3Y507_9PEZI
MDTEAAAPLQRSVSQQSGTSMRSQRSQTVRPGKSRRLASQQSSSTSSIAASDKSLTSFPSFSPESPRQTSTFPSESPLLPFSAASSRQTSGVLHPGSGVETVTSISSPCAAAARDSLFEDTLISSTKVPGALHLADNEHIERLIARHGAVNLVRLISEDLAQRDLQVSSLRRKADERERALRKIIRECGLSNLDLETRLRTIEQEAKQNSQSRPTVDALGLSDLVTDAMAADVRSQFDESQPNDATIRATNAGTRTDVDDAKGTTRGWKEYIWGSSTTRRNNLAATVKQDPSKASQQSVVRAAPASDRRPTLAEDLFNPPEQESTRSSSRASSVQSIQTGRKSSLASLALRLVAGGASTAGREGENRGRTNSLNTTGSLRTASASSGRNNGGTRVVSTQGGPRALMAMRRTAGTPSIPVSQPSRAQAQDRSDSVVSNTARDGLSQEESSGPVEMDTILPPEGQPPTQTHIYRNSNSSEYLTDRFGFIYDQRRKKRQREAADMAKRVKRGSRSESLAGARANLYPLIAEENGSSTGEVNDGRPGTPSSAEEPRDEGKPKRWQDYLKIATFPTELLSHTPSISVPGFEVMEGGELPKSVGLVASEGRGFLPPTSTTTALDNETQPTAEGDTPSGKLLKEDAEPVKLLLRQLSDLHDALQRDKTVRWNDFLRKVRAERRREGEAAAAAAAAAAEARFERTTAEMPETKLGDGEMIGIAGLGNKGKVGRAKWNEFRNLVLGGIPVAYRAKIWTECSGASVLRVPGHYESLVGPPSDRDDPQVVSQIQADITRTLTDNIFFRKGPGVSKLKEVLLAYSRRNPDVGYCQGMNLVAANLLLIVPSAKDAFWILASMIENILPANYYDHSLLASRADQQVLRGFVAEVLPKLSQHFDELSIDLETMTFQWFLSIFTDCLSAEALFRVWDVVLCTNDGSTFLFQVALALLKLNEQQLLACSTPAKVYTYINHQMTNHAISIDGLIQASEGLRRVVRREDVEARRARAIEVEKDLIRQREERNSRSLSQKADSAPVVTDNNAAPAGRS